MAQIIKHRRGSISALKDVTANVGELVMATGSIGDFNGPVVFVGDTAVAGGYKPVSKIYQGTTAPTISVGSHGSTMDGLPFYSTTTQTLYILDKSGNSGIDLTGNIEGNLISGVTINNLTGTTAYIANVSGSFTGSGQGLYDIPASGITGLELNRISEGSATASISQAGGLRVNTNTEITGALIVTSDITGSNLRLSGNANIDGNITLGGNITIGDATTDIINFGGEVSSSIVPDVHNAFDLGSPTKNWRNLHVSGTAYIDILEAQQVNFNDLGILTDLTVSGSTYLGNGGDITVVSGALYNDQLTQGRIVHVGTNGQLVDNENFTYDLASGFLMNTSGSININTSGSLNIRTEDEDNINLSSSWHFYMDAAEDVRITAGDDMYLNAYDVFSLRNYSLTDPITLNTKYGSGDVKTLTFDELGNLTIPGGFTGSFADINTQAQLASAAVEDLTDNRIVIVGVGGELEDDPNFTFDGTVFNVGQGSFEVDTDGDIRTSGSLTINKIYGKTNSNNSLHLNGGDLGAPNVELESSGQISLFSEGVGSNFAINMTGSVNMSNGLGVTGSLTVGGVTTFNNDLNVTGILTVTGETRLQSNLYVSGNLEVLGSSTNVNMQSNTVNIGDNIILVNAYSPFQQYAGLAAYDSGSSGASGSLLWDSLHDYWMFVSSSGQSSKLVGTTAGTYGSEVNLTSGTFPIASANNTIGDSLLTYSGTTLAFNTNKFTVDSSTGDALVTGNFTLSYSGGTDNGNKTSAIMFKNSSNVVGFVSTTETNDVMDGVLGYKNSTGGLVFSTVIDGGTY